jgi:hypothetical protein
MSRAAWPVNPLSCGDIAMFPRKYRSTHGPRTALALCAYIKAVGKPDKASLCRSKIGAAYFERLDNGPAKDCNLKGNHTFFSFRTGANPAHSGRVA